MNRNEYENKIKKYLKKSKIKEEVKDEILGDLEDFFSNDSGRHIVVEERLGEPDNFVKSYLTDDDLKPVGQSAVTLLKNIVITIASAVCIILLSAPIIWILAFLYKLPVEISYLFQFFVSLILFGIGFCGLLILKKRALRELML